MSVVQRYPRLLLSGVVYLGVIGSLFTGLYHPFTLVGLDRSWLILVLLVAAHLALGASWRSAWCYGLPVVAGVAGFLAASAHHNPWVVVAVFAGTPIALLLIAIGQLLALGARSIGQGHLAPIVVAAVLFLAAVAPAAEAARESYNLGNAPRLSPGLAQQLPLTVPDLNTLCQRPLPASIHAELTAAAGALVREVRRAGDSVVQASYGLIFGGRGSPAARNSPPRPTRRTPGWCRTTHPTHAASRSPREIISTQGAGQNLTVIFEVDHRVKGKQVASGGHLALEQRRGRGFVGDIAS